MKRILLFAAAITIAICTNANADIFQWTWDGNGSNPNGAGNLTDLTATYNSDTEQLLWSATFDADVVGVSLVLTPGPAPSLANDEVAIQYMNHNAELAAYAYSGQSGTDSYMTEPVIQTATDPSWQNNVFVQDNNNALGRPVSFGDQLGISLHWWNNAWSAFDDDGTPSNCWGTGRCAREGYLELTNQCTVPEPSAAMLILLSGILPFTLRRRVTPRNQRA